MITQLSGEAKIKSVPAHSTRSRGAQTGNSPPGAGSIQRPFCALFPMAFLPGTKKKADAMERGSLLYINNNSAG
jgi:hypothetical protein